MLRPIVRGAAANAGLIFHVFAQDSTSTTGAGKASVAYSSFTCYYIRSGEAISGAITPQDITTIGTYAAPTANTNIRIKAVDNTNMIGIYELQIHLDWVNTTNTCQSLTIYLSASGVAVLPLQIPLTGFDPQLLQATPTNITAGTITTVGTVTTVTGLTASDVGAIKTKTDSLTFTVANQVNSNVLSLNSVSQSLLDLKDFADDGYDPSTNKVQGVVLTDTVTTYTGNTPQTGDSYAKVDTEVASILAAVDTEVAAIKAKTDNLPSDPASSSDITAFSSALSSDLTAVKTQTDKFIFTVANVVDANVQRVNDVVVTGTGAPGTEWGP